jgi:hypothetical protein
MKTLSLKETQAPYTLTLDEAALAEGPVHVIQGEQIIGVLVPPDEYEQFRAWRETQGRRIQTQQRHEAFEREVAAFERMLPELLQKYRGQVVAIYNSRVVEVSRSGEGIAEVAERVYDRIGYVPVYIQLVTEEPRVYKITGPRLARQ